MLSNNRDIYAFSIAASILISIWSVFADPVINQDGVHYLLAAGDFTRGDFAAGLSLFKWPAYALLIALISKVTPLGVEASAHLLNALFFASLVGAFLVTVRQLGGTRTTLICAALVLLLFPSLNKFRPFIIRDAGYLSFYMWSLVFLLQHAQTRDSKSLIFGLALLGVAGLFRVEAFALAAMIPLMLFGIRAQSTWHKRAYWLAGATLTGVVSIGLVLWVFGAESLVPLAAFKAHPIDSTLEIFRLVFQQIGFRLDAIRYEFLTEFSGDFAALVLVVTLISMVTYETLRRLAFLYAFLAWHAWYRKLVFQDRAVRYFWQLLLLAHLVLLCAFTLGKMFIESRYTMALVLTIMIAVPFSLEYFYLRWRNRDGEGLAKFGFPGLAALIAILGFDSLDLYTDKRYIRDAGAWLSQNAKASDPIYSNNHLLMHYAERDALRSGRRFNWQETVSLTWTAEWQVYEYLALQFEIDTLDRKKRFEQSLGLSPLKIFANNNGDQVAVYQVPAEQRVYPEQD